MAPKHPESRSQSREPTQGTQPELQPQSQPEKHQRGRSRTRTHRSSSVTSTISESGPEEIIPATDTRRKRKGKKRQNTLPALDEVEATGKEVANTAQNAVATAGDVAGGVTSGGSDKPLKLRLDLNLDADIRLTAKIHGDVTLSLL